jgi:hypothetical protein
MPHNCTRNLKGEREVAMEITGYEKEQWQKKMFAKL